MQSEVQGLFYIFTTLAIAYTGDYLQRRRSFCTAAAFMQKKYIYNKLKNETRPDQK